MPACRHHSALLLVVLLTGGCEGRSPTGPQIPRTERPSPTGQPSPGGPPVSSIAPLLVGQWRGSSTVESTRGILPECIAPSWRSGFVDAISAEIQPYQGSGFDLLLHQQSSEACHLQVFPSDSLVVATPWPYDEFDCAIAGVLCGYGCHFQLRSSDWNCQGTPPDVWILGINLTGTFTDSSESRIQGTLEISYDHRPGSSSGFTYTNARVVKRFEITKEAR